MTVTPHTICARHKIQMERERWEDKLYGDIWCVTVAQNIHKVMLSERRQKNQLRLDFNSSTTLGWGEKFKWFMKDEYDAIRWCFVNLPTELQNKSR